MSTCPTCPRQDKSFYYVSPHIGRCTNLRAAAPASAPARLRRCACTCGRPVRRRTGPGASSCWCRSNSSFRCGTELHGRLILATIPPPSVCPPYREVFPTGVTPCRAPDGSVLNDLGAQSQLLHAAHRCNAVHAIVNGLAQLGPCCFAVETGAACVCLPHAGAAQQTEPADAARKPAKSGAGGSTPVSSTSAAVAQPWVAIRLRRLYQIPSRRCLAERALFRGVTGAHSGHMICVRARAQDRSRAEDVWSPPALGSRACPALGTTIGPIAVSHGQAPATSKQ